MARTVKPDVFLGHKPKVGPPRTWLRLSQPQSAIPHDAITLNPSKETERKKEPVQLKLDGLQRTALDRSDKAIQA
jgi:hypothetical protein